MVMTAKVMIGQEPYRSNAERSLFFSSTRSAI